MDSIIGSHRTEHPWDSIESTNFGLFLKRNGARAGGAKGPMLKNSFSACGFYELC